MVITERSCFYPDDYEYAHPASLGHALNELWIGKRLHAWHVLPARQPLSLVVHLHGNAQNMTSHFMGVRFLLEMGYALLTFDYRGYGRSPGTPTLQGIQDDAREVFTHVFAHPDSFGTSVFAFGQSMGGYTLGRVLPGFPGLKGAVIEAALISFYDLFRQVYPSMECAVPREGFSALDTVGLSEVPKLFIHGTADEVVPYEHSLRLHEHAAEPKDILILDGVGHLDAVMSEQSGLYRQRIQSFLTYRL